ncbi:LacI family DNA-binding transcriptional regulator [Flexivirga alba]|uniref:LacI family DNA-binding transcriptional regulator n=1 Tax=Flexivirga alba TaxID=702742 RepID=A0ABW2ACT7_9MICO
MTTLPADSAIEGRRPTMRDVAARAGVSLKTVSRVLNGESGVYVETAERVRVAARDLRFVRNESAATLKRSGQRSRSIGLVLENVANPYWAALAKAVEDVARERGFLLTTGSSGDDPAVERQLLDELCNRRVGGLLVVPSGAELGYLADEIEHGTVVVSIDRPAAGVKVDTVLLANAAGVRDGVLHLVGAGHHRIAFVGDTVRYTGSQRLAGYREALSAAGLPFDRHLVRRAHDAEHARAAARELLALDDAPTAIFAGNNLLTRGVLEALGPQRREIAVVGFDDFPFATLMEPPVTVVGQDAAELGRSGALQLFRRLEGESGPVQEIVLATTLVARGSGELTPAGRR